MGIQYFLLNQDVSHGLYVLVSIIWAVYGVVSARIGVITVSSSTKPDSGITGIAVVFLITNDTDSCFRIIGVLTALNVEPFLVAVGLLRRLRTNQRFPRVPIQGSGAVYAVGYQ